MRWLALATVPLALWAKTPQLAILPLSSHGVDSSSAAVLAEALSDAFLRTGKVRVMERQQIDQILKEQGFEQSGACDASECAVRVGQLLGIDQIVVGSIGKLGKSYVLSLRRVDVGTGMVISTSSRNKSGDIDDILGILDHSVEDLTGSAPKDRAESEAWSSPQSMGITRRPFQQADGAKSAGLPDRTAKVMERGSRSIKLELGRDPNSGINDLFAWNDSSGSMAGWARLSRRAHDPHSGGIGEAEVVTGDPQEGQELEKIAQAPWAMEACAGTESPSSDRRELVDVTALLWFRSSLVSDLRAGGGILLDINRLRNGSLEVAPGVEIGLHKGFSIQKRLGWFVDADLATTPYSEWRSGVQVQIKPGLSWELLSSLRLQATVGRNFWGPEGLVSNTSDGGKFLFSASLVWSPTYGLPQASKRGDESE